MKVGCKIAKGKMYVNLYGSEGELDKNTAEMIPNYCKISPTGSTDNSASNAGERRDQINFDSLKESP